MPHWMMGCEAPWRLLLARLNSSPHLTFAPDLTFEAQAFPFPVRRKSGTPISAHAASWSVERPPVACMDPRRRMPFSATVGPNPCRAVKESHCWRLHLDLPNLLIVLESLPAHIPDWINSTAAWVFGSSALESVGRCVAATSDDCSLMGVRGIGRGNHLSDSATQPLSATMHPIARISSKTLFKLTFLGTL